MCAQLCVNNAKKQQGYSMQIFAELRWTYLQITQVTRHRTIRYIHFLLAQRWGQDARHIDVHWPLVGKRCHLLDREMATSTSTRARNQWHSAFQIFSVFFGEFAGPILYHKRDAFCIISREHISQTLWACRLRIGKQLWRAFQLSFLRTTRRNGMSKI